MTATSRPDDASIALLFGAFSHLCAQQDLAGLLRVTAESGRRFGAPWHIGCLLRDAATDAWYLTALLDPSGRPVDLVRLQVPPGPFPFRPPEGPQAQPLDAMLGPSWGENACRMIVGELGTRMALCAPIGNGGGVQGALLALTAEQTPPLLQGIFVHDHHRQQRARAGGTPAARRGGTGTGTTLPPSAERADSVAAQGA